jgi:hypothetical protein
MVLRRALIAMVTVPVLVDGLSNIALALGTAVSWPGHHFERTTPTSARVDENRSRRTP